MEDHRLSTFCMIVEKGGFSKTAEAKFITQSAVSHLIKNLEEQLGVKLLYRKGKNIRLTQSGKLFYERAKKILEGSIKSLNVAGKRLFRSFYLVCYEKEPPAATGRAFKKFMTEFSFFEPF